MAKKDELNFETDNKMASSEKLKALQAAMEKIEKSFGKGSIMKMGDDSVEQVEVIPTGSIALNVAPIIEDGTSRLCGSGLFYSICRLLW